MPGALCLLFRTDAHYMSSLPSGSPSDQLAARLMPRTPVRVVYLGEPRGAVFRSTLRTVGDSEAVLDLLTLPNDQLPPQPGQFIVLVTEQADLLEAWDARVVRLEYGPARLVITNPIPARRDERRRWHRVACARRLNSGACVSSLGTESPVSGTVTDISGGGFALSCPELVAKGATMQVAFTLVPGEPDVEVTGIVVASAMGGAGAARLNLQLLGVDRPVVGQIMRFVRDRLRAQRRGHSQAEPD